MSTAHIGAENGDFAKVVLMPGDPLRAKWIAENFLTDVKQVTAIRGILGFTGLTKGGKRVSVMASGMGIPSLGIYSHELYSFFGVEVIIRIGTIGAFLAETQLKDLIIAQGACTDSNWASQYELGGTFSAISDYGLLSSAVEAAKEKGFRYQVGNVLSSDFFYTYQPNSWKKWAAMGCLGAEMESYGLYMTAAELHKKALCICSVSNSILTGASLTADERKIGLKNMVNTALAVAEKYA